MGHIGCKISVGTICWCSMFEKTSQTMHPFKDIRCCAFSNLLRSKKGALIKDTKHKVIDSNKNDLRILPHMSYIQHRY